MAIASDGRELPSNSGWRWSPPLLSLPEGRLSRFLLELFLVLGGYFAYHLVRGAVNGRVDVAFANAAVVIRLERSLGIFWEAHLQGLVLSHDALVSLFNWIYIWGFLPVIGGLALWIFFYRPRSFALYRNAFLISGAIGLIFFVTLPVAPPRFLPHLGFIDTVTQKDNIYHILQNPALVNEYAAMPSLHLGWNLLVGLAIFRTTSLWYTKAFGLLMPVLMLAAVVFTANHYLLDTVAGVAVVLAALWLAGLLNRRFEGSRFHAVLV